MPRKPRKCLISSFYHIMVQGINKEYIFQKEEYKEKYIELIKEHKKLNIDVIAFCVMDNHTHLLIHTKNIKEMTEFMWRINFEYARYYNKKEKRVGVVFRNRYRLEEIDEQKYLLNCIAYIHNNPVKAGIVKKCHDYKYSNYIEFKQKNKYNIEYEKQLINNSFENFIEIRENTIEEEIDKFINDEKMEIKEITKSKEKLKKLVKRIKERSNATNSEISKRLNISKTTVWNYINNK